MIKHFFYLFVVSLTFTSMAQETKPPITFSGTFIPKDRAAASVVVYGNAGQVGVLAKAKVTEGAFSMQLPDSLAYGVYKLGFGMQEKTNLYLIHQPQVKTYIATIENKDNQWTFSSTTGSEHTYLTKYWHQQQKRLEPIRLLYYFEQNYPLKEERIYKSNRKALKEKINAFNKFRDAAISKAPKYSKELLQQNKLILHDPNWSTKEREDYFHKTLWGRVPQNDSTYYKKPYFLDKIDQVFGTIIDDGKGSEKEKLLDIMAKLTDLISYLKDDTYQTKYYNLMIHYFANKQYPYVLSHIDSYVNSAELLSPNDSLSYAFRQAQQLLIGQKAAAIIDTKGQNIFNAITKETVLVFVGGNTPISLEILQQLNSDVATQQNTAVVAVLLGGTNESLQNFKALFPNWAHYIVEDAEQIQKIVDAYKLIFAPTLFILDVERTIKKQLALFETVVETSE